jgi:hypothetical protein
MPPTKSMRKNDKRKAKRAEKTLKKIQISNSIAETVDADNSNEVLDILMDPAASTSTMSRQQGQMPPTKSMRKNDKRKAKRAEKRLYKIQISDSNAETVDVDNSNEVLDILIDTATSTFTMSRQQEPPREQQKQQEQMPPTKSMKKK